MELKDRVAIISNENMNRLYQLYGNMSHDDLERIVNKHITVAVDEIAEDMNVSQSTTLQRV